ncbi:hypothetical protein [Paraburkholderia megapolitana]|uniref:hypothetical protein n=1 Tax=Paraburkholderia megapolitana TaxID=420953 RepID=UPI0038BCCAAA
MKNAATQRAFMFSDDAYKTTFIVERNDDGEIARDEHDDIKNECANPGTDDSDNDNFVMRLGSVPTAPARVYGVGDGGQERPRCEEDVVGMRSYDSIWQLRREEPNEPERNRCRGSLHAWIGLHA